MSIIFLDIDGILVHENHSLNFKEKYRQDFDPICVNNLKQIVETSNSKIVVHSTWKDINKKRLIEELKKFELHNYIIGYTQKQTFALRKNLEIEAWLKENSSVKKCVIIDDDIIIYNKHNLNKNFLWVENGWTNGGLKDCYIEKALQILDKNNISL